MLIASATRLAKPMTTTAFRLIPAPTAAQTIAKVVMMPAAIHEGLDVCAASVLLLRSLGVGGDRQIHIPLAKGLLQGLLRQSRHGGRLNFATLKKS